MRVVQNLLPLEIAAPYQSAASDKKHTQLEFGRHICLAECVQETN